MMICLESNIRVNNREAFNYILNLQDHQEVMGNPLTGTGHSHSCMHVTFLSLRVNATTSASIGLLLSTIRENGFLFPSTQTT